MVDSNHEEEDDETSTIATVGSFGNNHDVNDGNDDVTSKQQQQNSYKWYNVNTSMVPSKLAYFFECGRRIGYAPNLVLFLTGIGLNKAESGFIVGLSKIGMVLGGILCGMIADKWHCHRTVIALVCLISLAAITTQPAVSVQYGNPVTNQCPYNGNEDYRDSTDPGVINITSALHFLCRNATGQLARTNCSGNPELKQLPVNRTNTGNKNDDSYSESSDSRILYVVMFFINFCFAFSEGSAVAFVDTGTLRRSQLSANDRPVQYGRQRMFASAGAVFGIMVSNLSVDLFPSNTTITCYAGIFVAYGIYTVLYGVFTIISYRGLSFREETSAGEDEETGKDDREGTTSLITDDSTCNNPRELSQEENEKLSVEAVGNGNDTTAAEVDLKPNTIKKNTKTQQQFWATFTSTFFRRDVLFFYLTTLVSGLEYSQYTSFLYVYLKEIGDAPSSLLTLSIVLSNIASATCFGHAHNLIRILGGKWRAIPFSFLMYFVRYFGISIIHNPWLVLIFQPMHGITATLFVATGLAHLQETIPLPVITSLVFIFNCTHYGLGTFIGSSISGVVYQRFGGRALFRSTALLALAWFCVLVVYVFLKERRERKHTLADGKDAKDKIEGVELLEKTPQ